MFGGNCPKTVAKNKASGPAAIDGICNLSGFRLTNFSSLETNSRRISKSPIP